VSDHTDSVWFQCFNDVGNIIVGKNANDLSNMKVAMLRLFNMFNADL